KVAMCIRTAARERSLVLTITSDEFFVPWGLLYTHPHPTQPLTKNGMNFQWEGFWGLQHIIVHTTTRGVADPTVKPNNLGLIDASINIDERIDTKLNVSCIAPQLAFFRKLDVIKLVERRQKSELLAALSTKLLDRIVYFCCHGVGTGEPGILNLERCQITLTDGEPISESDIDYCLPEEALMFNPLVFINACQGGQMRTIFYKTLASLFLQRGAAGVIGPQIDIPAVFTAVYAQHFFEQFLSRREQNPIRVGPLMRALAYEFLTCHNNPLGLVYSLYRGIDCHVKWV